MISKNEKKIVTVSEVSQVVLGGTPKTNVPEYWDGNIKWASAKDVSKCNSRYLYETEKKITQEGIENSAAKILPKDTIIITARGTVGKIALLPEPMSFNQTCYGLIAKENILPLYLYYKLKTMLSRIGSLSYGTVFDTITMKTFDEIKIELPSLSERKKIVNILSSLDEKIELNQKISKNLESIGQTIFKHWFIDFEFPNEKGNPYKSSGGEMVYSEDLRKEIPKNWKVKKLNEISKNSDSKRIPLSRREREKRQGIYPYYGATGIMDYVEDYIFEGNYILMAEDGSVMDEKGFPIIQYVWGKFWVNNHAHILEGVGISNELLYYLLKNTNVYPIVTGAVQPKINQKNMNSLKFAIPNDKILKKFEEILDTIFSYYRVTKDENITLAKIRDALLPKLMSGKIRINLNEMENREED